MLQLDATDTFRAQAETVERQPAQLAAKRLTVAHVITQLDLGGAQRHVLSVLRRLDRNAFRVLLVTGSSGLLMREADLIPALEWFRVPFLQRNIHPLADLLTIRALTTLFKQHQVDIVHTHSSKAGLLGRLAGASACVPAVIHTVHGFGVSALGKGGAPGLTLCERVAARRADRLVAVSRATRAEGLSMRIGRDTQYVTIPYRIETPMCFSTRPNVRRMLGLSGEPVVGMIACLKPQKAPLDAVEVAARVVRCVPDVRFLFVGDGELRPAVQRAIQRKKLQHHVRLLGWRTDVPDLLSAMDVVVLTSRWEGLPIAVLEAMAMRKPVVATRVGGLEELVEHGRTGYLRESGDVEGLAESLVLLLRDAGRAERFGLLAKEKFAAAFHGEARMVSDIERLYREVIDDVAR